MLQIMSLYTVRAQKPPLSCFSMAVATLQAIHLYFKEPHHTVTPSKLFISHNLIVSGSKKYFLGCLKRGRSKYHCLYVQRILPVASSKIFLCGGTKIGQMPTSYWGLSLLDLRVSSEIPLPSMFINTMSTMLLIGGVIHEKYMKEVAVIP